MTVKQAFAILMTRWVLVLLAIYTMATEGFWRADLEGLRVRALLRPLARRRTSGSTSRPRSSRPARMSS